MKLTSRRAPGSRKLTVLTLVFSCGMSMLCHAETTAADAGQQAFALGDFNKAVDAWTREIRVSRAQGQPEQELQAQVQLSQVQAALGQWELAQNSLESALVLAERSGKAADLIAVRNSLGSLHIQMNQPTMAQEYLDTALADAQKSNDQAASASILNNIGRLRVIQGRSTQASGAFSQSADLARQLGDNTLLARASINLASLDVRDGTAEEATVALTDAEKAATTQTDAEKVELLTSIGATYVALSNRNDATVDSKAAQLAEASRIFQVAETEAERLDNARLKSLTLGSLGEIQEKRGDVAQALRTSRQARFFAQQANAAYLLYRWEWQVGRLLKANGDKQGAIESYRRAIATFRTLCNCGGTTAFSNYDETVRPLYYQLADLLLQRSADETGPQEVQALLTEARDTVELVKTAELSDYFQDQCVSSGLARSKDIDSVLNKTAVLYYIPLPDRTEILVGLKSGLKRVTVPVTSNVLMARARRLRIQLQRPSSDQYMEYSQQLYDWLIRPIEPILKENNAQTLVFVLDSSLRTIPMSVLNDGTSFLVQNYKIAIAPSLTLTDPRPLQPEKARVFIGGLSQAVQGFDALTSVPQEIDSIKKNYDSTTLLNSTFLRANMKEDITDGDYTIVHLASHGEFGSQAASTYLLTYDGKVNLNELESLIRPHQFHGEPVELLVLSACNTAAGDDRAALGMAGVAVKAGARSAMASLWSVSDEATAQLVSNFYTELKQHPENSKAEALQKAQLALMKDERFQHPSFWAPYLLIGNWM